jgi:serine/threonine protein kinase
MPVATAAELLAALRQSTLVPASRIDDWLDHNPTAISTAPRLLADQWVAAGLVTQFQAGLLIKGRPSDVLIAGKFKVLDLLGKGGMGAVYLCEHLALRTLVAVKVLPASSDEDRETRERFYREARAFATLNHPNLVRGFDVDTDGVVHYIVMEYVDGIDLQLLVARVGPLPVGRAVNYARQAAIGLAHAHQAGWVHRDIKPANLAIDRNGVLRVLDMGLARTILEGADAITRNFDDGYIRGTADYLAPEQAGGAPVDGRCDIYSLGVTLYFLLSGRLPFDEINTAQKLVAHLIKPPRPIRALRPDLPEGLAQVIDVMLAKQAESRYRTCEEVAAALAPWDGGPAPPKPEEMPPRSEHGSPETVQLAARTPEPPNPMSMPPGLRRKQIRSRALLALAAVVAVAAAVLIVAAVRTAPPAQNIDLPLPAQTESPFRGPYVPVTRKHGPGGEPFPGGHSEYLKGKVYPTVAQALKDPRLNNEDNCRILLLDEVHEEQLDLDAGSLPPGIAIESVRVGEPTVWLAPANCDRNRPLVRIQGGSRVAIRNVSFNGMDTFATLLSWYKPGAGCQLHEVKVTAFNHTGVILIDPAGEAKDPVQLSRVRIYPSPNTTVEAAVAVAAAKGKLAQHIRLAECRLEGPGTQGVLSTGGIESFEMVRCRLFGLRTGVRFFNFDRLQADLSSNTTFRVTTPISIELFGAKFQPDDRVVLRGNLFCETPTSAVQFKGNPPEPKLFRGSSANWCSAGGCQPETPGLAISPTSALHLGPDPSRDAEFLRYSPNSPLASAGPGGSPIGVPPAEAGKR